MKHRIINCLWFDGVAEEAARFYVSLLPDSRVEAVHYSPSDYPSGKEGEVLTVEFTLAGVPYVALNGGPEFQFNCAFSIQVPCDDQAECARLADALSADPDAEACGWVKDKYGLSWQIFPRRLTDLIADPDKAKAKRVMDAMMTMKRIDLAEIERAAAGG